MEILNVSEIDVLEFPFLAALKRNTFAIDGGEVEKSLSCISSLPLFARQPALAKKKVVLCSWKMFARFAAKVIMLKRFRLNPPSTQHANRIVKQNFRISFACCEFWLLISRVPPTNKQLSRKSKSGSGPLNAHDSFYPNEKSRYQRNTVEQLSQITTAPTGRFSE